MYDGNRCVYNDMLADLFSLRDICMLKSVFAEMIIMIYHLSKFHKKIELEILCDKMPYFGHILK